MKLEEIKKLLKDKEPVDYNKIGFGISKVDKNTGKTIDFTPEYSSSVQKEFESIKSKYDKSEHRSLLNRLQYNHNLNKDFNFDVIQFYVDDDLFKKNVQKGVKVIYWKDFCRTIFALFQIRFLKESDYQLLKNNLKNIKEILEKTGKHSVDIKYIESFEAILEVVKKKQIDIELKYLELSDIEKNVELFLND